MTLSWCCVVILMHAQAQISHWLLKIVTCHVSALTTRSVHVANGWLSNGTCGNVPPSMVVMMIALAQPLVYTQMGARWLIISVSGARQLVLG